MCEGLNNHKLTDPNIIVKMIKSMYELLELDVINEEELEEEEKVMTLFAKSGGFNLIEGLLTH